MYLKCKEEKKISRIYIHGLVEKLLAFPCIKGEQRLEVEDRGLKKQLCKTRTSKNIIAALF